MITEAPERKMITRTTHRSISVNNAVAKAAQALDTDWTPQQHEDLALGSAMRTHGFRGPESSALILLANVPDANLKDVNVDALRRRARALTSGKSPFTRAPFSPAAPKIPSEEGSATASVNGSLPELIIKLPRIPIRRRRR